MDKVSATYCSPCPGLLHGVLKPDRRRASKQRAPTGIAFACAAALMIGQWSCSPKEQPAAEPRPVETVVVAPAQGGTVAVYPAQILSRYDGRLAFRVSGRLIAKLVEVGQPVTAGQILARLDPADAELSVVGARAQVAAAESAARQQAMDLARAQRLLADGFISQAGYDRKVVNADQAQEQWRLAQSQLAGAIRQVDYTILRAARDGVVADFAADPGRVVQAGETVATIATPGEIEAAISIPEGESEAFRRSTLTVRTWSAPTVSYPGRIRMISPAAAAQTRTFEARIAFTPPPGAAAVGSTAEVTATTPIVGTSMRLPVSALSQRAGHPVVWVVTGTPARVSARNVDVVQVQQNAILVTGDVRPGDRVVTAGVNRLFPNEVVRPVPSTAPVLQ